MILKAKSIEGIFGDRIEVSITDNNDVIFEKTYYYGDNASYTRIYADLAKKDYEDSIKYGWTNNGYYCLKPYIGDILKDLCDQYNINPKDIVFTGYNVMQKKPMRDESLQRFKKMILENI